MKLETGWSLLLVLKIVTHTVHNWVEVSHCCLHSTWLGILFLDNFTRLQASGGVTLLEPPMHFCLSNGGQDKWITVCPMPCIGRCFEAIPGSYYNAHIIWYKSVSTFLQSPLTSQTEMLSSMSTYLANLLWYAGLQWGMSQSILVAKGC